MSGSGLPTQPASVAADAPRDARGDSRFEFGKNWKAFLSTVDESRIASAAESLSRMLSPRSLAGRTFLDIGCGSGLSSLAAQRLGARVTSFDFDVDSVACSRELKRRYGRDQPVWTIDSGSALDEAYLEKLGTFDFVYAWGVLHHTGQMWRGIDLAARRVTDGGVLLIAIYNDQGAASRRWRWIKRTYQGLPGAGRTVLVATVAAWYESKFAAARLLACRNPLPFSDWRLKHRDRGMSVWHDWVDWVGGWPFEVARPDDVIDFLVARGLVLVKHKGVGGGWGCNEYVFVRSGRVTQNDLSDAAGAHV